VTIEVGGWCPKFDSLGRKFFRAHAMSKPKNGFDIAWTLNLDTHSFFLKKGLPTKIFENKIIFHHNPIELW
jgi:hypothetical protein